MINRVRSAWRRYDPSEWYVILCSLVLLPVIAIANRALGFGRVHAALDCVPATAWQRRRALRLVDGRRVAELIGLAARRGPFRANCLHRSMLTWWWLARRGISTELRIGVRPRPNGSRPDFHAWIEVDGTVVNDQINIAEVFLPFDGPIARQRWT